MWLVFFNTQNNVDWNLNTIFQEWSVADLHIEMLKKIDRAGGSAPG
jgi:hypothetical protein